MTIRPSETMRFSPEGGVGQGVSVGVGEENGDGVGVGVRVDRPTSMMSSAFTPGSASVTRRSPG